MAVEKTTWIQYVLDYAWQILITIGGGIVWVLKVIRNHNDRLIRLELEMRAMKGDVHEIKDEMKLQTRMLYKMSGAMGVTHDSGGAEGD